MKKITFAFIAVLFVSWNFEAKAQCPPSMPLIAGDTNYVYHNVGTTFNSGVTYNCNAEPFYIWANEPSVLVNPINDIFTPCIKTDYNLYFTTERTRGTETFFEGGSNIGCCGPSGACFFPIGGGAPPANGASIWDLYFGYMDPSQQHDMVFTKPVGGWNTTTISVEDCWSSAILPSVIATPTNWVNATSAFTVTTAPGTNIGTCSYTLTPFVTNGIVDLNYGYCYIRPNLLPAGTYTVTYHFSNTGCAGTTSNFIFTIANPYTAGWTAPANLCSNAACVSLPPTVTGTAGGTWSGTGVAGTTFCPATSGAGTFPVTYSVGISATCSANQQNNITVTATPTLNITGNTSICSGQSTILTGATATNYTWLPSGITTNTISASPPSSTTYTLIGANGACTSVQTVAFIVAPTPTMSISGAGTICAGNSITLTAGTAGSYTWGPSGNNGTTETVSPGTTTTYTLTGANGACSASTTATVSVTPTPTITASASPTAICVGLSSVLTAGGATNYTWQPGGATTSTISVSPGSTSTYTVTGNDLGCTSTQVVSVTVNPLPTLNVTANPTSLCVGQTTTLSVSGALTYTWSANAGSAIASSATVTPAATDTYTVNATDINGCTNSGTVNVPVGAGAAIGITSTQTAVCSGQSTTLTGSGATNYTWLPGGQITSTITVNPSVTTTYTLNGTTGLCNGSETITVIVTATPTVTPVASSSSICSGTSTTLTASGATNYTWMPGGATTNTVSVSPTTNTTYTLIGETGGCSGTDITTVSVTTTPTVTASAASTGTVCTGQSIILTGGGAINYTWMPGGANTSTVSVNPTTNTTYTLTGANGICQDIKTVTVTTVATPTLTPSASLSSICSGASTTLSAGGAINYTWMPGGATTNTISVSPGTTTTYTLIGESGGCEDSSAVIVNVTATPTLTPITATSGTICVGQSTTLSSSGAANYTWTPGGVNASSINVSPIASTTYTVVGDNSGCTSGQQTVAVTVNPTPSVTATPNIDSARCGMPTGGVHAITVNGGTPAYTYQWYNGTTLIPGATLDSLTGVGQGTYSVLITDANGCVASGASTIFTVPGSAAVIAAITPKSTQGQSPVNISFTNGTIGGTSYVWNFGNGTGSVLQSPSVTYTTPGTYTVTMLASNSGGCFDIDTAYVIVDVATTIIIPNIFSPNGDGINDNFFIMTTGMKSLNCDIFNRWGTKMFTIIATNQVWDGKTPGGENASEGTYYYILSGLGYDGKSYTKQGPLTLVK